MAGYSGKSVAEKMGLKPDTTMWLINPPKNYWDIIGRDVSETLHVAQSLKHGEVVDCIHFFVSKRRDLEAKAHVFLSHLSPHGMLWISWPKKSSGVSTDISEQTLRDVLLTLGIVDVKVCAIDEVWSGLKFVRRK